MSTFAQRVSSFGTSVFTEINELAQRYQALNLGQGKPDFDTPVDIVTQLTQAAQAGNYNQYAPSQGVAALREAVAEHAERFYAMQIDPLGGVVVTAGATEGLLCTILGLVDPGDEVIVLEPCYDAYVPDIIMANAVPRYVPLHPPTWTLDPDELRAAFNKKTRAIILNTPHNPTGRVFSRAELSLIAELCIEHDTIAICDEVYEHLLFAPAQHIPLATLPGMFERTVTVSSAGKLFSATGWKVGWAYGHPALVEGVYRAHQFANFAVHHPTQYAVAYALRLPMSYYESFQAMYDAKRQLLTAGLEQSGLKCSTPQGTYFVLADFSEVFNGPPTAFTRHLIQHKGVACIPLEPLYSAAHADIGKDYVRFSFCKSDEMLREAGERLKQ